MEKKELPKRQMFVNREDYEREKLEAALLAAEKARSQKATKRGRDWEDREMKRLHKNEGAPKYMKARSRSYRSWNGRKQ